MDEASSSSSEQYLLERILDGKEKPTDLSLALLQKITNDFSKERKIGQGGFGAVYKGVLGERNVAVKRISLNIETIDDDDKQFGREFTSLWNTNHQNVIQFLGFCSNIHHKWIQRDGSEEWVWANVRERLFCFEYISNGSLDKHITDELRGLEWETRYEIITGICKGLHYLHEEKTIIHMDLKPENILLDHQDEKYIPKITDFGLSRPNEKSYTMGRVYGTRGYCAPEYSEGKNITPACDIYSLGGIIRELVAGCMEIPNKDNVLRRWRHRWRKPPTPLQYERVTRCMEIAVRCREKKPEARPSISEIIGFLSESESTGGHTGQEISTYLDDDMLGIEPLELRFTLKLKRDDDMHGIVKLTNKTKAYFSFNIERPNKQYTIWPNKGIVPPGCIEYPVQIIVHPEETVPQATRNADKFIVRSTKVSEGPGVEHVTEDMFRPGAGKVVDEVDLMVLYGPVSLKRGQDPNVPVDVVSHKAVKSSSYNKFAQGQCNNQLYRHNFQPPESFSQSQPTNRTYLERHSDRAMDVTRGAMGSLLHKLGVLHKEFNLGTIVKKDADNLVKMQQVLRKVSDAKQDNLDDMVKLWACDAREMSYDLEDFVDGFLVHSEPDSNGSDFRGLTHEMYLDKGESQQPISDLTEHYISKQVQDAAKKYKECKVEDVVANATTKADIEDPRMSGIHIPREELIGIEEPKKKLISLLEEDGNKSKINIVSIFGSGGLGKTTLAKAVYDKLQAQYLHRAFVPVGQNPDVKKILKNILYACGKNLNAENLEKWQLQDEVHKLLKNKRYFIVIDDIWGSLEWNAIRRAFPENENGSRMMITTRYQNVALACCNSERKYVHEIKPLSEVDSKELFFRRIFGSRKDHYVTPRKEEISKYILKRCHGMPLAINSIASLLAVGKDSSWEYVCKSLGALIEGNDGLKNMMQILDLSYIHLPDHLKTCLLYVCMYPDDREIDKNELLRKWVAEGFVGRNDDLDAEDVAQQCFEELINMCMIQPEKIDYNNEVLSCRVHDIILDLMRSKSRQVNFIQVIDGSKDVSGPRGEIRRVSVQYNDKVDGTILETIKVSLSRARSVLLYRAPLIPDFLEYKYVRVLHLLDELAYKKDLDLTAISSLFLLRYLKITYGKYFTGELKLPDKIGQLQQLETIDLEGGKLKNYPSDIVTLPQLSHLRYSGWIGLILPDGIERLKSLHTLEGVCVGQNSVETTKGLGELTKLKNLGIRLVFTGKSKEVASAHLNALYSSILGLSRLKILTLNGGLLERHDLSRCSRPLFPLDSLIQELHVSDCSFKRCPEWIGQLHCLHSLTIEVRKVADGFSIVGRLPALVYFKLTVVALSEEIVVIPGSGAFQALKHLSVDSRNTSLTFEERAMPKLQKFGITLHHRGIPDGIEHLPAPSLKEIAITVTYMDNNNENIEEHNRELETLLKSAFKLFFPSADIYIEFVPYDYLISHHVDGENFVEDGNEEQGEDDDSVNDEEADEAITDDFVFMVMEVNQHFGRVSKNTDAPLMVHTSVDLAVGSDDSYDDEDYYNEEDDEDCYSREEDDDSVDDEEADEGAYQMNGSEGQQGRRGSQDLAVLEYSQLLTGLNLAPNQLNDEELLEPRSMNCSSCIHAVSNLCLIILLRVQAICNSCLRS